MMHRLLSWMFTLLGLGLLGAASYLYLMDQHAGPQLELADSDVEVPDAVAEREMPVVFHYHNRSGKPIRILGGNTC